MASADHIVALLRSHIDGDEQRFLSIALQLAAHEAKLGHSKVAVELKSLVDKAKHTQGSIHRVQIKSGTEPFSSLLSTSYPQNRLNDMVLSPHLESQVLRIIKEQKYASKILQHGLNPRRKLLLVGPPGTGKTLTASVLATELGIPLFQVRLDAVLTKFMGESASKLRQIFGATMHTRGVYFFDEFDAIGSQRGLPNDVGEIRRILNSFLQMIEEDSSHSIIVAATNHEEILDHALFRRFDDILHYDLPNETQISNMLKGRLGKMACKRTQWIRLGELAVGLSYAEITRAMNEVLKDMLIHERNIATESDLEKMLVERLHISRKMNRTEQ